jgi:hypothetical protein
VQPPKYWRGETTHTLGTPLPTPLSPELAALTSLIWGLGGGGLTRGGIHGRLLSTGGALPTIESGSGRSVERSPDGTVPNQNLKRPRVLTAAIDPSIWYGDPTVWWLSARHDRTNGPDKLLWYVIAQATDGSETGVQCFWVCISTQYKSSPLRIAIGSEIQPWHQRSGAAHHCGRTLSRVRRLEANNLAARDSMSTSSSPSPPPTGLLASRKWYSTCFLHLPRPLGASSSRLPYKLLVTYHFPILQVTRSPPSLPDA